MAAHRLELGISSLVLVLLAPAIANAAHQDSHHYCLGSAATVIGTSGDDRLEGTVGADVIAGLSGDDTVIGLGGDDYICAGEGDDTVTADDGADFTFGGEGDDELASGEGNDHTYGGADVDLVLGDAGDDVVRGGPEYDIGSLDRDEVIGGFGNDLLLDSGGLDAFVGGEGNDSLGYGADVALIALTEGVAVSENDMIDFLSGVENVLGYEGTVDRGRERGLDPVIRGDGEDNILVGGFGVDHIYGLGGNDLIDGYCGADELHGGAGSADVASFRVSFSTVTASLETGTATRGACGFGQQILIAGFEGLAGGYGNDSLTGDGTNNYLYGGPSGNDLLSGLGGDDVLEGAGDRDALNGGAGTDRCLNGENNVDCEVSVEQFGPRQREAVELLRRYAAILAISNPFEPER